MTSRIPARIISAWFGPTPEPEAFAAERARWRELMPGWSFLHVTSRDDLPLTTALAADGFPPVVLSDLARMELVHRHGGIWLDLDVTLLRPLDPLRAGPFVTVEHPASGHHPAERRIASGVFGAPAGMSVLAELARVADARVRRMTVSPVIACGPELWTMFGRDLAAAGFRVLPHPAFHPTDGWPRADPPTAAEFADSYGVHRFTGTWR